MKTEMTLMKATIETNTNLTYVIDEENRTVECTVKNCIDDFFNVIDRKIKGYKDNKIIATLIDFMTFSLDSDITIKDINIPQSEYQDKIILEIANKIYNFKYEVINGSKTVQSIKNKIIKEQREEHTIVFIDYTGYIVGKQGQNDRERIGEAVRELNNITKDYDCTIFLIAQINRNGSDIPTMQDLKDSGEIEQTADTIILIHDDNKENNIDVKEVGLLIPKCRGGKRNIRIPVIFNKPKQRFEVK